MSGIKCEKHGVRDCMLCRVKNPTIAQTPPAELDPQAQEAAARLADTSPVEVDFGDVEASWNAANTGSDSTAIATAPTVEAITKEMMKAVTAPGPAFRIPPSGTHLAGNPIVDAAAAYTSAQESVDTAVANVAELESELASAKARLDEVRSDRDMKKQVLQALVGGAS